MMVARTLGRGEGENGELLNGYRVSVLQDETELKRYCVDMDGGAGCTKK